MAAPNAENHLKISHKSGTGYELSHVVSVLLTRAESVTPVSRYRDRFT